MLHLWGERSIQKKAVEVTDDDEPQPWVVVQGWKQQWKGVAHFYYFRL